MTALHELTEVLAHVGWPREECVGRALWCLDRTVDEGEVDLGHEPSGVEGVVNDWLPTVVNPRNAGGKGGV